LNERDTSKGTADQARNPKWGHETSPSSSVSCFHGNVSISGDAKLNSPICQEKFLPKLVHSFCFQSLAVAVYLTTTRQLRSKGSERASGARGIHVSQVLGVTACCLGLELNIENSNWLFRLAHQPSLIYFLLAASMTWQPHFELRNADREK